MILDSNIIIAYLDNEPSVVEVIHNLFQSGVILLLPAVVHTEVLSCNEFTEREIRRTDMFLLENFAFVHVDARISRVAAHIRRSVRIKTPDAYVAATALAYNAPLLTRNVRYFHNVPNLTVQTV